MSRVRHRFLNHKINPQTESLIVGTFNPDVEQNKAEFFYGRSKNYLWKLLPLCFDKKELKSAPKEEKLAFIKQEKIDFIDLITEIEVEEAQEANYNDSYIDNKVSEWRDVIEEIKKLKNIKRVCLSRKTYSDIPHMKIKILEIEDYCRKNGIVFKALSTPARFYNDAKQREWKSFFTRTN